MALVVKNLPANAGAIRDAGSIPGLERSPGGGQSNPLQYSCLDNPVDRGAWWACVHGVINRQTWLSAHMHTYGLISQFFSSAMAEGLAIDGSLAVITPLIMCTFLRVKYLGHVGSKSFLCANFHVRKYTELENTGGKNVFQDSVPSLLYLSEKSKYLARSTEVHHLPCIAAVSNWIVLHFLL